MTRTADPYALLDVPQDATAEQIRAAYLRAARAAHPDVGGDSERFVTVQHAYELLSDPARRAAHDLDRRRAAEQETARRTERERARSQPPGRGDPRSSSPPQTWEKYARARWQTVTASGSSGWPDPEHDQVSDVCWTVWQTAAAPVFALRATQRWLDRTGRGVGPAAGLLAMFVVSSSLVYGSRGLLSMLVAALVLSFAIGGPVAYLRVVPGRDGVRDYGRPGRMPERVAARQNNDAAAAAARAGGDAERRVAAALRAARPAVVAHGVDLPGLQGDVDHVVLGPVAAVVETKAGSGNVTLGDDGDLWRNGRPVVGGPVSQSRRAAQALARWAGLPAVSPVVCITGMSGPPMLTADGVVITSVDDLADVVRHLPHLIDGETACSVGRRMLARRLV